MDIVYQDSDLVIVNKPAGLLTVPGLSHPENAYDRLLVEFPSARVVHRLDMATSGLVIFALHYPAQRQLGKLFENRKISKRYIAVVFGRLSSQVGEIASPLMRDWDNRPRQKVDWLHGKPSLTGFRLLEQRQHCAQLELTPYTGRSHQLRVHMLQLGHPILGDQLYGSEQSSNAASRLLLHATELYFRHPVTDKPLRVNSPPSF